MWFSHPHQHIPVAAVDAVIFPHHPALRQQVLPLIAAEELSAAVYTEVSDVEDELNGILTFDRRVCKLDEAAAREINGKLKFM